MLSKHSVLSMLLVIAMAAPAEATPSPGVGSFGFNWLGQAQCRKLSARDLPDRSRCQAQSEAFGLSGPSHRCKVSRRVEFMVYKTAAQCRAALERMQANGP